MIRGAIFDVDGTLLNSMYVWETIGDRYLKSLGIEPRENLWETFRTFTLEEAARYYRDQYGVTLSVKEIMEGGNRLIETMYFEEVQPKPGVQELLQKLQDHKVPMVIATATDRYLVEAALRRCGLLSYFQEILTCREYGSKENPGIFEAALSILNTPKADTWVFEDAHHAAATAAQAGFPVLGIFDPSETRQQALKSVSNIYLEDFTQAEPFYRFLSPKRD